MKSYFERSRLIQAITSWGVKLPIRNDRGRSQSPTLRTRRSAEPSQAERVIQRAGKPETLAGVTTFLLALALAVPLSSCRGIEEVTTNCDEDPSRDFCQPPAFTGSAEAPRVLTPGEEHVIAGSIYDRGNTVTIAGLVLPAYPGPNGEIAVLVPEGLASGRVAMVLQKGVNRIEFSNAFSLQDTDYPLFVGDASLICSDTQFYNGDGTLVRGTKTCSSALPACTGGGQTGCATTEAFRSVEISTLAAKLASSTTAAGVSGSISDCSSDGETGCITVADYPALDKSAITEWDIKTGKSAGGITGSVKTACRNAANLSLYNYDGNTDSIPDTGIIDAAAPVVDWWDTIDNWNNNTNTLPTAQPAGWTADNLCGKELWEDITSDGTCDSAADDCLMRDNVSGLTWSEGYPVTGVSSADTTVTWDVAVDHCNDLSFGGIGAGNWRLPTEMELQQASIHGIRQLGFKGGSLVDSKDNNAEFIADVDQGFWSATSYSNNTGIAWRVGLPRGNTYGDNKTGSDRVLCVSP